MMLDSVRPYAIGLLTYTPFRKRYMLNKTGGTNNARYCYAVFMRHLKYGWPEMSEFPQNVAELGPGDSIGVGLCWLIAGAKKYYAFDVENYTESPRTLAIFDELVELFRARSPIPTQREHPNLKPNLDDLTFPSYILTENQLRDALNDDRLANIRNSLNESAGDDESPISFLVPWHYQGNIRPGSIDLIYSQAVMEHVDDLGSVYENSKTWLRRGGIISHQIDFKSHGTSVGWDGYRAYSDLSWRIVRGTRPYAINRVPSSEHFKAIHEYGFRVINEVRAYLDPTLAPRQYAKRFKNLDSEDKRTAGLFIQAVKESG